ncbi:MAG: putative esterase lipoprotein [Myxococcaceae bacterium]|nr:putative esterase lipoprotein [Myxococcaceae bacterium]
MKNNWRWFGGLVCLAGFAAGCAVTEEETGSVAQEITACPEAVTRDGRGEPRNAAGQVRNCWPGEAHCFCDRDNDCYAESGYVACAPPSADAGTAMDAGPRDAGPADTGPRDTGPRDTGPRDTGPVDTGPRDTGPVDTGPRDTGPAADAGPLPADTISYTGSFAVRNGRSRARLTVGGVARDVTVYLPSTRSANPPVVIAFHGTNGSGDVMLDETSARAMADRNGVVFIAPDSRWIGHGDWDHATEETYWETSPATSPNTNPDLMLTRAIIVEAQRRFNVDPRRVYAIGHSSGGFFTELVATQLTSRIAAFATSSAGLVRCARTTSCRFQGTGTTCAALRTQSGWCGCTGADLPGPVPTSGRIPPAYLTHGTRDPLVSVQYTCALAERMTGAGAASTVVLRNGDGHVLPETFALDAWAFLSPLRLP